MLNMLNVIYCESIVMYGKNIVNIGKVVEKNDVVEVVGYELEIVLMVNFVIIKVGECFKVVVFY